MPTEGGGHGTRRGAGPRDLHPWHKPGKTRPTWMNAIHRGEESRASSAAAAGNGDSYFQHCLQALSTSLLSLKSNRVSGNALVQASHGISSSLYLIVLANG